MLFTVQNLLKLGAKSLNKASNSKDLDAEILLSHILKINRATMLAQTNKTISYLTAGRFWWLIFKRRHHIPIAYLTGRQEFYGHSFLVNKNVLIPRPETELLIEIAMSTIRANSALTTAIDIGTGSGCIAITLALEFPKLKILASDISKRALKVASQNSKKHKVNKQVQLLQGDLLEPFWPNEITNSIIVANLPYLKYDDITLNIKYEPHLALVSGQDGLYHYQKLLKQIKNSPVKPQAIFLELHPPTAEQLKNHATELFPNSRIEVVNDLANRPRVLRLELS